MVQTYGAVRPPAYAESEPGPSSGSEQSALLGGERDTSVQRDGHASLTSCVSNLANTIMGTGMLTFPLAMASAGMIPGVLTCVSSGVVGAFGLYLLSVCATYTPHRRASFFSVAQLTFPRAAVFFDAAIAIKCFGVSIRHGVFFSCVRRVDLMQHSYLIIVKGLMPNVVKSFYHVLAPPTTVPPAWMLNGANWISIFMVVIGPLAFLRRLDSLRHTSYVALFSVAYLVVIVVACYFWPIAGMPARGDVHLIKFTPSFVSTFPIQVFAYTCAQNLFPMYNEVRSNTQARMNIIIGGSIGSAIITYEVIAVFGYLTFGSNVGANIIAMYPQTSLFIAFGQVAIVISVLSSYALQVHPCRNCLGKVLQRRPATEEEEDDDKDHAVSDMSALRHALLTSVIIGGGFSIAYFVDDLRMGKCVLLCGRRAADAETVLAFVGSTGSTTISFILPGLFYWKVRPGE
ncbi:hypothetical protein C0993_010802 [Termitomyces sp. T159_Od127]|nr:hypothetical protein C0993_010802 [Termitomyces sp. T159_Od127]